MSAVLIPEREGSEVVFTDADELAFQATFLLDELGGSSTEIAKALLARRITGTPKCIDDCALARYLISALQVDRVEVGLAYENDEARYIMVERGGVSVEVAIAEPVQGFVDAFDSLHYRFLEKGLVGSISRFYRTGRP